MIYQYISLVINFYNTAGWVVVTTGAGIDKPYISHSFVSRNMGVSKENNICVFLLTGLGQFFQSVLCGIQVTVSYHYVFTCYVKHFNIS